MCFEIDVFPYNHDLLFTEHVPPGKKVLGIREISSLNSIQLIFARLEVSAIKSYLYLLLLLMEWFSFYSNLVSVLKNNKQVKREIYNRKNTEKFFVLCTKDRFRFFCFCLLCLFPLSQQFF